MPQALAFILPSTFAAGGSAALFSAAGSLTFAGAAVSIGSAFLINSVIRPDTPSGARPENAQINSKTSTGARMRHYGIVKVGGVVVFHRASEGISYRIIVHGHGQVTQTLQRFLNNVPISTDASGFVSDEQYQYKRSRVQLFERLGLVPENHYQQVSDVWSEWTSNHRLDGLWSSLLVCESVPASNYRAMYPRNEPEMSVLAETTKCFDPRLGQLAFTENMALAIADYVASPDGFNRPDAFEDADIVEQADICDRDVALAAGGTEKLFRVSATYLLNEKPQDVLGRMLEACAGRIRLKPTGKVGLKVGVWTPPEFVLKYADVVEVRDVNSGPDILDRYNVLPARFNSHDLGHIEVDAEIWRDSARIEEDGEELLGQDKNLLMSPSHRQTRHALQVHMERENTRQEVSLLCKASAFPAIYEDVVRLDIPQLGLEGDFEVEQHGLNFENGMLRAVSLTLRLVSSGAFSLSLEQQGNVQTLPEPDTPSGVPLPGNVTAASAGVQAAQNTFVAGIAVAWQAPPSDALTPVVQVSLQGAEDWRDVSVGDGVTSINIPGLIAGQFYDVSVAFVTPGDVLGVAVIVPGIEAAAVTSTPLPPTNLTIQDAGAGTALVNLTASASDSLWKTEIYRDGSLIGTLYAGPEEAISFVDDSGAGTFSWAARSVNVSNLPSNSDAGPVVQAIA